MKGKLVVTPPQDDPSCTVKNTFLEFSVPESEAAKANKRRTRSDMGNPDVRLSPLVVASKSPGASPILGPMDEKMQAVPIDEVAFELLEESGCMGDTGVERRFDEVNPDGHELVAQASGPLGRDEPAYVVPTTPSPFLHSAFPPAVVPPFSYSYGMPDMGLPPAFGAECENGSSCGENFNLQEVDGQYMQAGMSFMPDMYDSSYGYGGWSSWTTPPEGGPDHMPFQAGSLNEESCEQVDANAADHCEIPLSFAAAEMELATEAGSGSNLSGVPQSGRSLAPTPENRPVKELGRRKNRKGELREEEKQDRHDRKNRDGGNGDRGNRHATSQWAKEKDTNGIDSEGANGVDWNRSEADNNSSGGNYTTVMLRNIPNKYTREMLVKQLSVEFYGGFDFMYLPIDFKNKCNVGYGFVNFREPYLCEAFITKFHGVDVRKCLPGLNSKKIVEVTPARVQGLSENVRRLRNSPVMNQLQDHPEWMPLLFNKHGEQEPFPMPDVPLPPVKPRGRNREGRHANDV